MATKNEMRHCKACKKMTVSIKNPPNHILHLILSVLTVGIWVFVWVFAAAFQPMPRCTECGSRTGF